jgi:hypothetical protein
MKTFYHGTHKVCVDSILREGLLLKHCGTNFPTLSFHLEKRRGVYLGTFPEARAIVLTWGGVAVAGILTVTLPDDWKVDRLADFGFISHVDIPPEFIHVEERVFRGHRDGIDHG